MKQCALALATNRPCVLTTCANYWRRTEDVLLGTKCPSTTACLCFLGLIPWKRTGHARKRICTSGSRSGTSHDAAVCTPIISQIHSTGLLVCHYKYIRRKDCESLWIQSGSATSVGRKGLGPNEVFGSGNARWTKCPSRALLVTVCLLGSDRLMSASRDGLAPRVLR